MSKLFFDIGANIGEYSLQAIKRDYTVVAVEANPDLIPELQNKLTDQTIINKAVSKESGQNLTLYIHSNHELSTVDYKWKRRGRFSWRGAYANMGSWEKEASIETISLQDLVEQYGTPDLVKVDVEEHELDVISGLTTKVPELCFQWHQESVAKIESIFSHLSTIGFSEFGVVVCTKEGEQYLKKPECYTNDTSQIIHEISSMDKKEWNWGMIWCQ